MYASIREKCLGIERETGSTKEGVQSELIMQNSIYTVLLQRAYNVRMLYTRQSSYLPALLSLYISKL